MRTLAGIPLVVLLSVGCSFDRTGHNAGDDGDDLGADADVVGGVDAEVAVDRPDAGPQDPDATPVLTCSDVCPGTCTGDVCRVDCIGANDCRDFVCPTGFDCVVNCTGNRSCRNLSCGMATSCEINCTGNRSCEDVPTCGPGACDIQCTGPESCRNGADCADSCACTVFCADSDGVCGSSPSCRSGCSADEDNGCVASGSGCDVCGL